MMRMYNYGDYKVNNPLFSRSGAKRPFLNTIITDDEVSKAPTNVAPASTYRSVRSICLQLKPAKLPLAISRKDLKRESETFISLIRLG